MTLVKKNIKNSKIYCFYSKCKMAKKNTIMERVYIIPYVPF